MSFANKSTVYQYYAWCIRDTTYCNSILVTQFSTQSRVRQVKLLCLHGVWLLYNMWRVVINRLLKITTFANDFPLWYIYNRNSFCCHWILISVILQLNLAIFIIVFFSLSLLTPTMTTIISASAFSCTYCLFGKTLISLYCIWYGVQPNFSSPAVASIYHAMRQKVVD